MEKQFITFNFENLVKINTYTNKYEINQCK